MTVAFDASQHGDTFPLPREFDATIAHLAWLSSLLIGGDLNWIERLIVEFERALVERTARRARRRMNCHKRNDPMTPVPVIKQVPSPNYSASPIAHDLVIVHLMEGGYAGSVAWLCDHRAAASAHLCMNEDGTEFAQLVPLSLKAWAQCAFNGRGVSIEAPGFTAKGVADATLRGLAWATAWLLRAYGVPCRHASGGQGRGFCSHHDLGQAGGGHVDICGVGDATWQKFSMLVRLAYDDLAARPLPAWALHGLPAPHQVELPPDVAPEPSHGGARRSEPGDAVAHPTSSGYPHGSVSDLQWRLNRAGAQPPLDVDGRAGKLTRDALAKFQGAHGLFIDGRLGAKTWAALDAASWS